jgi:hypothetical protein
LASTADDTGIHLDPVELRTDLIRVTRELELRGAGLVITHRISPTDDIPVEFRIEDTLVSNIDVDDLGFHPAFEPSEGRFTPEKTVIEGIVEPGYAREIISGICPAQPKPPEAVRRLHESVLPTIEKVHPWEPDPGVRKKDTSRPEAGRATSFFARLKQRLGGLAPAKQSKSATAERSPHSEPSGSELRREDALEHVDDVFSELEEDVPAPPSAEPESTDESAVDWAAFWGYSTDETTAPRQGKEPDDPERVTQASAEALDDTRRRGEDDVRSNLELGSDTIARANEEFRTVAEIFEDHEIEASPADSNGTDLAAPDIAKRLRRQLDRRSWPYLKRRRLAQELLGATALSSLPTADLDHRLDAVETRVDEITEYSEALAATIDTHGSAQAYLDGISDELAGLDAARRRVRTRLDQAASEREWIQGRLEDVVERTTHVESRLDRLEDQEAALRSRHQRTFSSFATEIAHLESAAESVVAMEAEVQPLREVLAE